MSTAAHIACMCSGQLSFFEPLPSLPEGFQYRAEFVSADQEAELLEHFRELDFREYEFNGYLGKRRVVSFGLHYDTNESTVRNTDDIPGFLLPLRQKAAGFARLAPAELHQALVTEYTPGAAIGWHRDRPAYRDVIGFSFSSSCRFRFRRKLGSSWERASLIVEPRSVYLLRGPARTEWQHSIPPAERLRYSVTFRSMRGSPKSGSARGGVSGRDRSLASRPFRLQSVRHAMGRCGARDHVLVTGIEPASDFLGDLHGYCRGPGKLTNG